MNHDASEPLADTFTNERTELLRRTAELAAARVPFALATVVRIEPPSSARPGHRAIVFRDGSMEGWIGGGCAAPTVQREAAGALADGEPRFVRITPDARGPAPDGMLLRPMTCSSGGTVDVWIEPFLPAPVLVIGGSSPVASALAEFGTGLGFRVVPYAAKYGDPCESALEIAETLRVRAGIDNDELWFVAVSHGEFDDEFVEAGVRLGARYVGLVASARRAATVRVGLHQRGLDDDALDAFRPSAGIRIGAKTPHEIALAVMAEIVSQRRTQPSPRTAAAEEPEPAHCCHHSEAAR